MHSAVHSALHAAQCTIAHDTAPEFNTAQHNTTQHSTTQHSTTQHSTTQHNRHHNTPHSQHAPPLTRQQQPLKSSSPPASPALFSGGERVPGH
eukprot:2006216-Rhodomonas_salina.1